jgi:hypothetical protein
VDGRLGLREAVAVYEAGMRRYGYEAVRDSLQQMTASAPVHHPLWGGPALAGTKAMLRLANAVPAFKRRMATSQTRLRNRRRHPALAAVGL